MSLSRHALMALLIAAGAAVTGVAVWANGRVDLGLRLDDSSGVVRVADVTPDGIAAHQFVQPGSLVIRLETTDGRPVGDGPVRHLLTGEPDGSGSTTIRLPTVAIEEPAIASLEFGYDDGATADVYLGNALDRQEGEAALADSPWLMALGLVLGAAVWLALRCGLAGPVGRQEALVFAAAAAAPFLALPVVYAGTATGIAIGYLVPTATALVAASALARHLREPEWRRAALVATAIVAALTVLILARYLASPTLAPDDRFQILALLAAIALVPAIMAAVAATSFRDRASFLSVGLLPGTAATIIGPSSASLIPFWLLMALLAWQLAVRFVPLQRGAALMRGTAGWVSAASTGGVAAFASDPQLTERRDIVAYLVGGLAVLLATTGVNAWALLIGLGLGALVGFGLRQGVLGPAWTDAAAPIGVAIAVPIIFSGFGYVDTITGIVLPTVAALVVAHLIAWHHPDPGWRGRHFAAAAVLAAFALVQVRSDWGGGALIVSALVPLVPGLSLAFGARPGGAPGMADRLETLVVALTPGIGMLAMVNGPSVLILLGWLGVVLVWRRFTLAPLLGIAQRSQQQLDLAVAAAEQERARLAADLHDDALQALTGLVRRLDEAGDAEGAEMARGVAERLRGITSDLRLPLLDDLGAGPALEWLVARVRPMAGGEVRLERTDPSRPPSAVELAVFRVAQEALANAVKHGKTPITVRYHVDEAGHVSLTVDDAGPGIDLKAAESALASGHLGMANMQQRAEQIGALLNVRAWPSGGTHVGLEWRPQ